MALSPEARLLLAALRRGETVSRGDLVWVTSGGQQTTVAAVRVLIAAELAEYFEWRLSRTGARIGTAARLAPQRREAA